MLIDFIFLHDIFYRLYYTNFTLLKSLLYLKSCFYAWHNSCRIPCAEYVLRGCCILFCVVVFWFYVVLFIFMLLSFLVQPSLIIFWTASYSLLFPSWNGPPALSALGWWSPNFFDCTPLSVKILNGHIQSMYIYSCITYVWVLL